MLRPDLRSKTLLAQSTRNYRSTSFALFFDEKVERGHRAASVGLGGGGMCCLRTSTKKWEGGSSGSHQGSTQEGRSSGGEGVPYV